MSILTGFNFQCVIWVLVHFTVWGIARVHIIHIYMYVHTNRSKLLAPRDANLERRFESPQDQPGFLLIGVVSSDGLSFLESHLSELPNLKGPGCLGGLKNLGRRSSSRSSCRTGSRPGPKFFLISRRVTCTCVPGWWVQNDFLLNRDDSLVAEEFKNSPSNGQVTPWVL